MSSLINFLDTHFNTQRQNWEKTFLAELKLPEIGNKATKRMSNGLNWPTLSLERRQEVQLTPEVSWKKASTTYAVLAEDKLAAFLTEDLKSGVRNFFFHEKCLNEKKWQNIESILGAHSDVRDIEVFIIDAADYKSSSFKVVSKLISGKDFHDQGAHSIQELALMCKNLIEHNDPEIFIGVYVDSQFFHNIAKIRAARLLAARILQEKGPQIPVKIVALTSYQGWTIFERYSNMLRNETAVACGYIGGADHVQSAGYNTLIEIETENDAEPDHFERSQRMARNTSHILGLESMLGVVEDASFGSYHLENLTQKLCEEAWSLMQRLVKGENIGPEIEEVRNQRLLNMKTRKTIISGINEYPDVKEVLSLNLKDSPVWRPARAFEELRLRMGRLNAPQVYIALFGDYGALNARLNFVKNYFELLGLKVNESGHSELDKENFKQHLLGRKEDIIVLCSSDDQYSELSIMASFIMQEHRYIAGKFEMPSFKNLFAGQNVYEILESLVKAFEGRKS